MPKNTRVHRCVEKVKRKGGAANPYAVCQAATGQNYHTGKPLKDSFARKLDDVLVSLTEATVAYVVHNGQNLYWNRHLGGWVDRRSDATWYTDHYEAARDAEAHGGTIVPVDHLDPGIIGSRTGGDYRPR